MVSLTERDYDALYEVFRDVMPRVSRDLFPDILSMLVADGVLAVSLTENEIVVASVQVPNVGTYRIARKMHLH